MKNGLTITAVFDAQSANYGETAGNVAALKSLSRGGNSYTYISRQALRYCIVGQLGWDKETPVTRENKKESVIQFQRDASIKDYPEIDLFGYMKTKDKEKKKDDENGQNSGTLTRHAVARLSHAISLESYKGDTDFLNNMGLARRLSKDQNPNLANSENHKSFYAYTLTLDLDRVGVDEYDGENKRAVDIPPEKKVERVNALLDTLKLLYRDIRGRRENLNPLFAAGGIYERKNPYFADRVKLKGRNALNVDAVLAAMDIDEDAKKNTVIGYASGTFGNEDEIKEKLRVVGIREFFDALKKGVNERYGG